MEATLTDPVDICGKDSGALSVLLSCVDVVNFDVVLVMGVVPTLVCRSRRYGIMSSMRDGKSGAGSVRMTSLKGSGVTTPSATVMGGTMAPRWCSVCRGLEVPSIRSSTTVGDSVSSENKLPRSVTEDLYSKPHCIEELGHISTSRLVPVPNKSPIH